MVNAILLHLRELLQNFRADGTENIHPMKLSPDQYILFDWGWSRLNGTICFTWLIIVLLAGTARLITRNLSSDATMSSSQNLLEVVVSSISSHIHETIHRDPVPLIPFVGTLFLFIFVSNVLAIVPFYLPPTASLSTTTALALCVFLAVPFFGLSSRSIKSYLSDYIKPTIFMFPFNILGEISRTFALAVRLYGNMMSGSVLGLVILSVIPFVFPVVLQLLGLLTGVIQAYIFAILAMVYIAAALKKEDREGKEVEK